MNNLEPNMYIRTKEGKIDKVLEINTEDFDTPAVRLASFPLGMYQGIFEYEKASHNIIDLIEERDFVKVRIDGIFINWFMVDLFEDENENQELGIGCYEDGLLNSISEYRPLNTLEILEVLTKEQFESMSYKVGE